MLQGHSLGHPSPGTCDPCPELPASSEAAEEPEPLLFLPEISHPLPCLALPREVVPLLFLFTDEEAKAPSGEVASPGSQSWEGPRRTRPQLLRLRSYAFCSPCVQCRVLGRRSWAIYSRRGSCCLKHVVWLRNSAQRKPRDRTGQDRSKCYSGSGQATRGGQRWLGRTGIGRKEGIPGRGTS